MSEEAVDMRSGEIIPLEAQSVAIARAPEAVLAEAQKAARALQDVISKKRKPVVFNGEQYLEFEDWQTVGKFYGLLVKTHDAEPVEIAGVGGAKARADVLDVKSGNIVGGAESYCMRDESNWEKKPWFQLASMAQTRAGSKALRNVLAWVVVLAGYKATPAEEMTGQERGGVSQPGRTNGDAPRVMKAKFPSECPLCDGGKIKKDDDIYYNPKTKKAAHKQCYEAWMKEQEAKGEQSQEEQGADNPNAGA